LEPLWGYVPSPERWTGYLEELFQLIALELGYSFEFVAAPAIIQTNEMPVVNEMLTSGATTLHFADLNLPNVLSDDSRFISVPWHTSSYTGLVLKKKAAAGKFRFMDPFTDDLYYHLICVVVAAAVLVSLIDIIWPSDEDARGAVSGHRLCDGKNDMLDFANTTSKGIYHMTAFLLAGEDYEWLTSPMKIFRIGMLIVALIVQATYTANLAAFLSTPSIKIYGPKSMDELRSATACVWVPLNVPPVTPFVGTVRVPSSAEIGDNYPTTANVPARKALVYSWLNEGTCDVLLADADILQTELLNGCANRSWASFINIAPINWGFVANAANRELLGNFSTGLAHFKQTPKYMDLRSRYLGGGVECPIDVGDSEAISADMMMGVFYIFYISAGIAIVLAFVLRVKQRCKARLGVVDEDSGHLDHAATEGEMLRALLKKVDDLDVARRHDNHGEHGDRKASSTTTKDVTIPAKDVQVATVEEHHSQASCPAAHARLAPGSSRHVGASPQMPMSASDKRSARLGVGPSSASAQKEKSQ